MQMSPLTECFLVADCIEQIYYISNPDNVLPIIPVYVCTPLYPYIPLYSLIHIVPK